MYPDYQNTGYSPEQARNFRLIKLSIVVIVVIILAVIATLIYQSRRFHVVRTEPGMSNVSSIAPFIKFDFNKPVKNTRAISISSKPEIIQSFGIDGKQLTLGLGAMDLGKTYTITLESIPSTSGEIIKNKTFTFTAQDISFADLPKDQQQAILKAQQNEGPKTRDSYTYINIGILTNNGGLTMYQSDDVKQALFEYIQDKQLDVGDITFSNFKPPIPHPESPLAPDKSYVDVSFNGNDYRAKIVSLDLKTIKFYLSDANGKQIYSSGKINTYDND